MMKKRKAVSVLCAAALVFSLTGCGASADTDTAADYSGSTLTGQVTVIDGSSVTLQLGELTEQEMTVPDGQAPDGQDGQNAGEEPPELPDGDTSSGEVPTQAQDGQTPPEQPDGEEGQTPPDLPENGGNDMGGQEPGGMGGSMTTFTAGDETATLDFSSASITRDDQEVSLDDIAVGDVLTVEVGDKNTAASVVIQSIGNQSGPGGQNAPGGQMGFGGSGEVTQGTAANTIDADGTYTNENYSSTGDDENALRVDGATVTLDGIAVNKSAGASSNTEDGDFYGMNAALLATNGANVTITNATITSSAQNGNGVFSYGAGTTVTISDSTITTTADNSGGIQTTGGGATIASDLTVETSGSSAAAIRSDRGGGTVNVDGGSYTSNGYNSPAVYSTADITVKNATLTANNSEALVIEGQNSITLENCDVSGNMSDTNGTSSDENVHNVMIYQSMSGDAEVGTSVFSMTGGTLTSYNGDLFYITNTHCILTLSGVDIVNHETDGYLLLVTGNSASRGWGTAGANGAQVEFTADGQTLEGDIAVDTISTLTMTLSGNSSFTGTINMIDNAQGGAAVDSNAVVTVEAGSTWTLTGNCTLTSLTNSGTINFNGYTITLADGTVLGG